jgi:hypothetical protein
MKKYAVFMLILVSIFLASQLTAQVESKTQGTGQTTEKKSDTKSNDKAAPPVQSSKTKPGTTGSGQTTGTQPKQGTSTSSQPGTVTGSKSIKTGKMFDAGGNLIYSYDELGYIRNPKNRVFCQLTPKGEIIRKRVVVGTAVNGIFQDKFGREYARIVQDGKVVDAKSKSVGTIKDDGAVLDKSGTKIGSAPGVDKNVIVIIYFYKDLLDPKADKSSVKK